MNGLRDISRRLAEANAILMQCKQGKELTFAQAEILGRFYCDYEDTNRLVQEAMTLAESDAKGLLEFASSLSSEAERFYSIGIGCLQGTNFEDIFNAHIKPWKERHEEAMKAATELWRSYTEMSNRLDFLPLDSEEYKHFRSSLTQSTSACACSSTRSATTTCLYQCPAATS